MKREFLMLAHKLDLPNPKQHIGGWWYSEKLDGERCFWDGGVSRNIPKDQVPWANCAKDARYNDQQIATGLWSRYGNIIHAPDWFLDVLPLISLDGELYAKEAIKRQFIHSTIKTIIPNDSEWQDIVYMVFDSPPPTSVLRDGIIDTTNFKKTFKDCENWWFNYSGKCKWYAKTDTRYESMFAILNHEHWDESILRFHNQYVLPFSQYLALAKLEVALTKIVESGGEGLMVRDPNATYECCRSHKLLKIKPFDDAEGTVIGYITGRETNLGSKLLGMMGALILRLDDGNRLELSGFTDSERQLGLTEFRDLSDSPKVWAIANPETECLDWIEAVAFPRGSRVTFKYRGKSADGIPLEARYWRKYAEE